MKSSHDLERHLRERCGAAAAPASTLAVIASVAVLLCACSKVNVTPLGSTSQGRRQFEITCNKHASDSGACHEQALAACGGDYETLDVDNSGPRAVSYAGQLYTAPGQRVLLIACNRGTALPIKAPATPASDARASR